MGNTKLNLEYIGQDDFSCPTYMDQKGKIWKDINLGHGTPSLYSVSGNELDGEPEYPIKQEYSFGGEGSYKENPYLFEYMLLSRMKMDCDYFLGYGRRSIYALHGKSIPEHIASMKKLWNMFPADAKPEWLPWEQIREYEAAMGTDPETKAEGCKALEKRGIFVMPET